MRISLAKKVNLQFVIGSKKHLRPFMVESWFCLGMRFGIKRYGYQCCIRVGKEKYFLWNFYPKNEIFQKRFIWLVTETGSHSGIPNGYKGELPKVDVCKNRGELEFEFFC